MFIAVYVWLYVPWFHSKGGMDWQGHLLDYYVQLFLH